MIARLTIAKDSRKTKLPPVISKRQQHSKSTTQKFYHTKNNKMKSEKNEVATLDESRNSNGLAVTTTGGLSVNVVDVNSGDLPDLSDAEEIPLDLMSDYWTPKLPGETKRVFFDAIRHRQVQDAQNPEVLIELPCAYFFEKVGGEVKTISNGSKRLVAALENLQRGTPVQIEYLGKKKNATNSFQSDNWSVKLLQVNA